MEVSREEVEEEAEEEELAGRKVRCLWPSGLYHGPLESRGEPYLQESGQWTVKQEENIP